MNIIYFKQLYDIVSYLPLKLSMIIITGAVLSTIRDLVALTSGRKISDT